jgi:hypothetical protein
MYYTESKDKTRYLKKYQYQYKTLQFEEFKERMELGTFAKIIHDSNQIVGCEIPELMNYNTKLKDLKKLYPKINFNNVALVRVKLK